MAEDMSFVPRSQLLSLEELSTVARCFSELGVNKIRVTGGEPLIRKDIGLLFEQLGQMPGLTELNLSTNGSHLDQYSEGLAKAGVNRINVSLDSLDKSRFKSLTRTGDLDKVLAGIQAAKAAGFKRIKLNAVIMKNRNADEVVDLVNYALAEELDISFIEEMPLGHIDEHSRQEEFCSSAELREIISQHHSLQALDEATAGPSRYWKIPGYETRIGFISPHSENFCGDCNRVRLTAEGRLLLCLGNEHSVDLKAILRQYPGDDERLKQAIIAAMDIKPERHYFSHDDEPQIVRFMNATGG
jgi:cyclic pyranopterin phosphate synthase